MTEAALASGSSGSGSASIVVPVRLAAWMAGELGRSLEQRLLELLGGLPEVRVERLPRSLVVQADETPGPLLEAVHQAVVRLEEAVADIYPVLHHEIGPIWTGTLQVVFREGAGKGA